MESKINSLDQNNDIKVSVFCITYNHEKYIAQALEGFISQITDFRYEVIVHDDASTDNTQKIIQQYVDLHPDLFIPIYETDTQYSIEKERILRVMGTKARGKYIAFCEGDDYWVDPYKLQKQYDALEKYPECGMCFHKVPSVWEDGTLITKPNTGLRKRNKGYGWNPGVNEKEKVANILWLRRKYPFQTSSHFMRKTTLEDLFNGKAEFVKFLTGDVARIRLALMHGKRSI